MVDLCSTGSQPIINSRVFLQIFEDLHRNSDMHPPVPCYDILATFTDKKVKKLHFFKDEVTGLAVSERYIVAQYFMEPTIDVFDRKSLKRLHRLEGEMSNSNLLACISSSK